MKRINFHLIIFLTVYFSVNLAYAQVFDKEPDKKILTISKVLKDSTRVNPEKYLPILTEKLTSNISDQFRKVKTIHDWITTEIQYDTEPYLRYSDLISETNEVLREKRGICVGYCNLFNKMCSYVDIESVSISGVAKPAYITEE
ncbi:MAG: transglutaminase domain-containing protein, partial [Ignavibacteria bacterium]